jgi:hypothetical protein
MKDFMRQELFFTFCLAFSLAASSIHAQETNQIEILNRQLNQMRENFEKQQLEMRERFERLVRDQQMQIDALKKQLESAQTNSVAVSAMPTNNPPSAVSAKEIDELKQRVDELTTASKKTFISQFNPGIGFAGDTIFSYSSKGMGSTGSDRPGGADVFLRTAELNLEATVDPFARAYGVIAASADARTGEAAMGVEEAALVTTSLPWNLTMQAGRFFADFGRLSYVHDHDLPFVYRPLVLDRYISGESQTDGLQVNYLFPTEHYISLTLGVGDRFGGDPTEVGGFRSLHELNYWGHLSTYFDLNPNLSLETGVSGLFDDSAQGRGGLMERRRAIAAADITLRYQPLATGTRRGLVWGTEILFNSAGFDIDPDGILSSGDEFRKNVNASGLYSYLEMKLDRRFKTGFAFDWMQDVADKNNETYRYSPYIAWNPSEFQTIRLQYSHTDRDPVFGLRSDDAVYLQWTFILGRHVHGFKQR